MVAALENGKARRRAAADEAGGLPAPPPDASDLQKVLAFAISDDAVIGIGGCGDLLLGDLALDLLEDGFSLEDARVIAVFLHHCGAACRDAAYAYDCAREDLPPFVVRRQGMRERDYDAHTESDLFSGTADNVGSSGCDCREVEALPIGIADTGAAVVEAMSIGIATTTP